MDYLFLFGLLLLMGLLGGFISSKLKLPAVTGYIIFGLILGPSVLNILTPDIIDNMGFINNFALGLISISVGYELQYKKVKEIWNVVLKSFLAEGTITFALTFSIMLLLGLNWTLSLLLGVLALTSSPVGIMAICKECGAKGKFTNTLIGHMSIDNIVSTVLFAFVTSIIQSINNANVDLSLLSVSVELLIAVVIGVAIGFVITYLAAKISNQDKLLVIIIGGISVGSGFAEMYDVSALLLNMSLGATITNLSPYRNYVFKTLERIELPVLIAFLTLAGAKLDVGILPEVGLIGIGYILARSIGKIVGGYTGGLLAGLTPNNRKGLGLALTPQAGVVIGLSIIAEQKLHDEVGIVTTVVLAGVVVFEVFGPLLVKKGLSLNDEA